MIVQPTMCEVAKYTEVGGLIDEADKLSLAPSAAFQSLPSIAAGSRVADQLPDIPNAGGTYDMKYSTIGLSGADVSTVSDLSGNGRTLVLETDLSGGGSNRPLYVASDAVLGGRPACSHDRSNSEAMQTPSFSSPGVPHGWWCSFQVIDTADSPIIASASGQDQSLRIDTSAPDSWELSTLYGVDRFATFSSTATSHLVIVRWDDDNTEVWIDNSAQSLSFPKSWYSYGMTQLSVGYDQAYAQYGEIAWTAWGWTTNAPNTSTRLALWDWHSAYAT